MGWSSEQVKEKFHCWYKNCCGLCDRFSICNNEIKASYKAFEKKLYLEVRDKFTCSKINDICKMNSCQRNCINYGQKTGFENWCKKYYSKDKELLNMILTRGKKL